MYRQVPCQLRVAILIPSHLHLHLLVGILLPLRSRTGRTRQCNFGQLDFHRRRFRHLRALFFNPKRMTRIQTIPITLRPTRTVLHLNGIHRTNDDFNQLFSDPMMSMVNTNEDTPPLPLPSSDPVIQNGIADFDLPNSGSR